MCVLVAWDAILTHLVWRGRSPNPRHPARRTFSALGHRSRYKHLGMRNWSIFTDTVITQTGEGKARQNLIQRDLEFHHSHPSSFTCRSKAPIHGTDILRPHLMDEARKLLSCLRTHRTQRSGWTRTRHPEFLSPRLYRWAIARMKRESRTFLLKWRTDT